MFEIELNYLTKKYKYVKITGIANKKLSKRSKIPP
jgi:hypothetical protein